MCDKRQEDDGEKGARYVCLSVCLSVCGASQSAMEMWG